jgi:hypothetical protein
LSQVTNGQRSNTSSSLPSLLVVRPMTQQRTSAASDPALAVNHRQPCQIMTPTCMPPLIRRPS